MDSNDGRFLKCLVVVVCSFSSRMTIPMDMVPEFYKQTSVILKYMYVAVIANN